MLTHYRKDWERIVDGRFDTSMDEFLDFRRSLPGESLKGDYVKSFGEKVIANTLFEHDVDYQYERSHSWNSARYRPDFTLKSNRVGIEYFGLTGDPDYDEQIEAKRKYWSQRKDWDLVEVFPQDLLVGPEKFVSLFLQRLGLLGVESHQLPEEEIWNRVRGRAIDSFSKTVSSFVGRCRSQNLGPSGLRAEIRRHSPDSESEALFLEIGLSVFEAYLTHLKAEGKEDFNGLVWRAIEHIREGNVRFSRNRGSEQGDLSRIDYLMVDEFQDFSPMFFDLTAAMRKAKPEIQAFCVGDDWQAINGFAGSDLRFFNDFSSYFDQASELTIGTNYRSPTSIVTVGNALMDGLGEPGTADRDETGTVAVAELNQLATSAAEREQHGQDAISPAILRLVRSHLDRGQDVVLLSRLNKIPWPVAYRPNERSIRNGLDRFVEHLRSFLPEEDRGRLHISTTHKFKGMEQTAVIVLDAVGSSYPFIHPMWGFFRILGDTPEHLVEEERRLFYVAISRSLESLTLVSENGIESPFLEAIKRHAELKKVLWDEFPPVPSLDGERLEIRVSNAFDIRDQLKDQNYEFVGVGKYWRKAVVAEGFSLDRLAAQPWNRGKVRISVVSEDGEIRHIG
jgi:DNA helicase-4